jgi:hypothetical protein
VFNNVFYEEVSLFFLFSPPESTIVR